MIKINGEKVEVTIFPDKTSQVWKVPILDTTPKSMHVRFEFEHEGEIFHLCQLVRLIRHARVPIPLTLHMPYLPYGRQDKDVSNETTFALQTFGNLINNMGFDKVTTTDAHSRIAGLIFKNFESIHPSKQISQALRKVNATAIAFPDKGASDRYFGKDETIGHHLIIGHKVRDQSTGYIKEYNIEGDPQGKDVLIIDDICDGGMTFRLLARDLIKAKAASVNLYVTHGIFSKGIKVLLDDGISRIFTKDGEIFSSKHTNFLVKEF